MRRASAVEPRAQALVGGDAAGDDQRMAAAGSGRANSAMALAVRSASTSPTAAWKRGGEVGDVAAPSVPAGQFVHQLADRGLEAGEGEVAAGPALHRARQVEARGVAVRGRRSIAGPPG